MDAGLGLDELEGCHRAGGEGGGGGGCADVGGRVVACCSDKLRGAEDYAACAAEAFDEGGGHYEIWVGEIEVVGGASALVA